MNDEKGGMNSVQIAWPTVVTLALLPNTPISKIDRIFWILICYLWILTHNNCQQRLPGALNGQDTQVEKY